MVYRHYRKLALLLGLLLGIMLLGSPVKAINVAQDVQQGKQVRVVVGSSTIVLTSLGNQTKANGATVNETTQQPDPVLTSTTSTEDGIAANIVSIGKNLSINDHYYEFTIQAEAADVAFPSGKLRLRYLDSGGQERESVAVASSGTVDPGRRAGATIRLPGTSTEHITDVNVVFEESLTVSGITATVTRVILSVSGLVAP